MQPATELIKEIAVLELEVVYLEQHLLSLYRKAFDQKLPQAAFVEPSMPEVLTKNESSTLQYNGHDELENLPKEHSRYEMETLGKEKHLDSGVYRCHSSLSHCTAFTRASPAEESLTKALRACHSQPLSMMEVNLVSRNSVKSNYFHVSYKLFSISYPRDFIDISRRTPRGHAVLIPVVKLK